MLFGEYAVLLGAPALAIPYDGYRGKIVQGSDSSNVRVYIEYLIEEHRKSNSFDFLDMERLEEDLSAGIDFESDIPQGYGLGSSGALCAALLHQYGLQSHDDSVARIHERLKTLEHYFHGESSGLDPLVSYYDRPVVRTEDGSFEVLEGLSWNSPRKLWLLNLGQSRQTQALVEWFMQQMDHPGFRHSLKEEYVPLVSGLCHRLIEHGEVSNKQFKTLSLFQWNHFRPLIPEDLRADWKKGLEEGDWTIKLCGAGGGGMMLLLTGPSFDPRILKWELIPALPPD